MNQIKLYIAILFIACGLNTSAQTSIELHITHRLGGITEYNKTHVAQNDMGKEFTVTRFEYYISNISITHDGGTVTDIQDHYILANAENDIKEDLGSHSITNVESISFSIGVDTPTNHEDPSLLPNDHPLAPKSPSMHWGWTDGYRFVAMEGKTGPDIDKTYEIHSLGDAYYFQTNVTTTAVMKNGKLVIPITADLTQAVKGIDVAPGLIDHGSTANNIKLLENFRDNVFKSGDPVSVNNVTASNNAVRIYPNPAAADVINVDFGNNLKAGIITVSDIRGSIISQNDKAAGADLIKLNINQPGMYFISTRFADGSAAATQKLIVQ